MPAHLACNIASSAEMMRRVCWFAYEQTFRLDLIKLSIKDKEDGAMLLRVDCHARAKTYRLRMKPILLQLK